MLDHPHIVPVNSVVFQLDRGLRGLSMPLRQGLPLDEIIRRVRPADRPRRAILLWEVLVQGAVAGSPPLTADERDTLLREGPRGDGWSGFPARGTYAQGVAWVGMILARAIHYAHGMKTFHRDVKPGNVLITVHHGPQLLDFNLAESPHSAQHAESAMLGGTLPYMATEQIEAFLNPELWGTVGAKADLYSLGLVLRELLTGQAPDLPDDKLPPARSMPPCSIVAPACRPMSDATCRRFPMPWTPSSSGAWSSTRKNATPMRRRWPRTSRVSSIAGRCNTSPTRLLANDSRTGPPGTGNRSPVRRSRSSLGWCWVSWPRPRSREHLKPPIESRQLLREVKRDIDEGRNDEAIGKLERLESDYPEHFIPKFLLGIAHSGRRVLPEDAAFLYFRQAMASPGGKDALRDWAVHDPKAALYLARIGLVWGRNLNVNSTLRNVTAADPSVSAPTQLDHQQPQRAYAEAILQVLELALELDPSADDSGRDRAGPRNPGAI